MVEPRSRIDVGFPPPPNTESPEYTAMKTYGGWIDPRFLDLGTSWR
jgi:hypothetical protein